MRALYARALSELRQLGYITDRTRAEITAQGGNPNQIEESRSNG